MTAISFQVNRYILGAFQMGYISLRRALRSENNHGRHIEGSFQTEVLKTSPFKGPFRMKDFEGYNWWTLRAPMILCAESLHDDGASMSVRDDDAEGHFRVVWSPTPFNPSKLSLRRATPLKGLGHRDEPFQMERTGKLFIVAMHAGNLSNIVQCNCSDYSVWKFGRIWICCEQILEYKGHCTAWVPKFSNVFFCFCFFSHVPIKILATDAKTQKIEPDPNVFLTD